jgi:uncharacterized protein with von Willebrand factor type A (vWA) domain
MSLRGRLVDLAARVERMSVSPQQVEARWIWLARPFYKLFGWQPQYETDRLDALFESLTSLDDSDVAKERLDKSIEGATDELETNIARAERTCQLNGEVATAHTAWLSRLVRVVARIDRSLEMGFDDQARRALSMVDPVTIAKPLALRMPEQTVESGAKQEQTPTPRGQVRLVELQLAAIDHIIEAARGETSFLERRRRLLEAARRLLLDADAALPLDAEGVRLRKRYLAQQIVQVDRVQATGISSRVALLHQARAAVSRGKRHQLHAALVAMEGFALAAGDLTLATKTGNALDELSGNSTDDERTREHSLRRSADEMYGVDVTEKIRGAYKGARDDLSARRQNAQPLDREALDLALEYLGSGNENATMSALLSVDGCFEVGAPLTPVRMRETEIVARAVPYPTEELLLKRARGPEDLASAEINDPRSVLLDLAAGRLLTRKYIRYEERQTERVEMVGEARVYVLDGSTSMLEHGIGMARARMRDAILVAELSTLMERFRNPQRYSRVVMFYRYFTKRIAPVIEVDSAADALAAIGDVLGTPRRGGTNIEQALESSFEVIRNAARGADIELARAQIVLITDGKAEVRDEVVRAAREMVGEIPVAVSVIALGEENEALRRLVARQRANGERAYYHFIDDDTLAQLCDGDVGIGRALHLPDLDARSPKDLTKTLGSLLDEVAELDRARHMAVRTSHDSAALEQAYSELGLPLTAMSDGQRALRAAAARDHRAVVSRYERWFPREQPAETRSHPADEVDSAVVVLATVAEVVGELGGAPMSRMADAIDVVERLLPDAHLSAAHFEALLTSGIPEISAALQAVHSSTDNHA